MTFQVLIQRVSDRATKLVDGGEWNDEDGASESYWADGNIGCDCNLAKQFGECAECGDTAYRVIEFRLSDGRVVPCQSLLVG